MKFANINVPLSKTYVEYPVDFCSNVSIIFPNDKYSGAIRFSSKWVFLSLKKKLFHFWSFAINFWRFLDLDIG